MSIQIKIERFVDNATEVIPELEQIISLIAENGVMDVEGEGFSVKTVADIPEGEFVDDEEEVAGNPDADFDEHNENKDVENNNDNTSEPW